MAHSEYVDQEGQREVTDMQAWQALTRTWRHLLAFASCPVRQMEVYDWVERGIVQCMASGQTSERDSKA